MSHRIIFSLLTIATALALLVASGCTPSSDRAPGDAGKSAIDSAAPSDTTAAEQSTTTTQEKKGEQPKGGSKIDCDYLTAPDASGAAGADKKLAVIETEKGTIKFSFYPNKAPIHVANFIQLAECGFYNGTTFHRVEAGFVIQGGDPNSKELPPGDPQLGGGGPGYTIPAEFSDQPHVDGTVAAARLPQDPNSAGSQFYVALGTLTNLDGSYSVFGQVTEGLDVVHQIARGDKMVKVSIEKKD